jgi:RsmE family RNA methyltransferase
MNLILFEKEEIQSNLDDKDPRTIHIRDILKLGPGGEFSAGIIGGARGRGRLTTRGEQGWEWTFTPLKGIAEVPPLRPLTLVLGCPRPPVARRILKDMSTLGLREIRVSSTDLNENSYLGSRLWREGLWRDALVDGAVQGGSTLIPEVRTGPNLESILENLPEDAERIAFDNDEGLEGFGEWVSGTGFSSGVLAVGPERGWSGRERALLDSSGFHRLHLGKRILRTETACSAGAALILASMGCF